MRILLIDDEIRKAQALIDYLQEVYEWNVEIAPGPDQALELLRSKTAGNLFDLIVLDVMMDPGTVVPRESSADGRDTGIILLGLITELTGGKVLIVLYTARTGLDYLKSEGRVAGYIQKPRTVRELAKEIEELVGAAKS